MRGYKFNHLATNSTVAVAAEARVNPALPATAVVEFKAKWSDLYLCTVHPPWTFGFLKRLEEAVVNSQMRVNLRKLALRLGQEPINPRQQKKF